MQLKRKKSNQDLRTQSYGWLWHRAAWRRCAHRTKRHMRTAGRHVKRGGFHYINRWTMTALSRLASFRVWSSSDSSLFGKVVMRTKLVAAIAGLASTMKSRMSRMLSQGIKHRKMTLLFHLLHKCVENQTNLTPLPKDVHPCTVTASKLLANGRGHVKQISHLSYF